MKKIIFYIIKNSTDKASDIYLNHKNSLIKFQKNKFFFNSIYDGMEEIIVEYDYLEFDEVLYEKLIAIKDLAIKEATKLSNEEIGNEKIPNSLNGLIYSQVEKSYHETPSSIFNFCARLFIKILMEHKLTNGNKRVAMLFLILMLRNFGYHLDWSKGINQNYKYYESTIKQIVEKLEKGYNDSNIKSIENWIKGHSTIALEWRK